MNNVIAKNTMILMGSQLVTWMLTLLLTIFQPRYLGVEGIGKLHFAASLWAMVGVLITFGTDRLLIKEIARTPSRTGELYGTSAILRTVLFGGAFAGIVAFMRLVNYPTETVHIVYIIGIASLFEQFSLACGSALQGLERMMPLSIGTISGKAIDTIVGITLLLMGWGIYTIASLMVISTIVRFLVQLYFLNQMHKLRLHFKMGAATRMLRNGVPYLFSNIFLVVYLQIDVIIISFLVNEQAIGWYGAADRLFGTLLFIPTAFMMAVFPVFSRLFVEDTNPLNKLMAKSFDTLLLFGVPIGLGVAMIANPVVILLFGEPFANSGPILAILGIALIFMYQNILLGQFLISIDRQNAWTIVMAIATVATILLDIVVIPWCQSVFSNGAMGGAITYVIVELFMVTAGIILLPKGTLNRQNIWVGIRIVLAGLGMVGAIWWAKDMFILIPITVGAIVYIGLVLLLQIVPKEDIGLITLAVRTRLNGKFRGEPEAIRGY